MSIATPATAEPEEPRDASTDCRQRSIKQARRADGVVDGHARRWPSTWQDVQPTADSARCRLPSGQRRSIKPRGAPPYVRTSESHVAAQPRVLISAGTLRALLRRPSVATHVSA